MTDTDPRVSTVFSDLQRTMLFCMMLAVMVRPAVTAMGNPSLEDERSAATLASQFTYKTQLPARMVHGPQRTSERKSTYGMKAMATLTQLTISIGTEIQSGWSFRSHVPQTINTIAIMVTMMEQMMMTK